MGVFEKYSRLKRAIVTRPSSQNFGKSASCVLDGPKQMISILEMTASVSKLLAAGD